MSDRHLMTPFHIALGTGRSGRRDRPVVACLVFFHAGLRGCHQRIVDPPGNLRVIEVAGDAVLVVRGVVHV